MTAIHALSHYGNGVTNQIVTDLKIKNPITGDLIETKAIWDTGATNTVLTDETALKIGLISFGKTIVSGVHGPKTVNRYFVNVTLNNESISLDIPVTECSALSADGSIGVLIGMDIINQGDFAINQSKPVISAKLPSRNDPCNCGSGKKYKHCCEKRIA